MTTATLTRRSKEQAPARRRLALPITLDGEPVRGNLRWGDVHYLYRLFDGDGRLLYVGETNDLKRRLRQHRMRKPWWPEVARAEAVTYGAFREAFDDERVAIWRDFPKYNVDGVRLIGPQLPNHRLVQLTGYGWLHLCPWEYEAWRELERLCAGLFDVAELIVGPMLTEVDGW